jgi:deoxyribodipyrimidine photolyase-related protein
VVSAPSEPSTTNDRPRIVLILGDQLSPDMHALRNANPDKDIVLMAEVLEEATYVPHHKKKIAFLFSAMRHFAQELRAAGWQVSYTRLTDPENTGSLRGEVQRAVTQYRAVGIIVTEPGEYRLKADMQSWPHDLGVDVQHLEDTRFLSSHAEFQLWAKGRKQLRMEFFYREMRRKTGLLMQEDQPAGGRWNYDAENRKPAKRDLFMPKPFQISPDAITNEVLDLVEAEFVDNFGTLRPFWYAVTRNDANEALSHFIEHSLPQFGDYQDAMLDEEPFLYHAVLSLYINVGLLNPLEVCRRAERAYLDGDAPLNAAEGFIRQIIGWREFVRGIYWLKMPGYTHENFFSAERDLPAFFWTGETEMACLAAAIGQTREYAYAHHIQRLMVTGNFAMLAGVDPRQVHEWYLAVYLDAYEWVEAPNVIGMSQFADGGLLGSKPYAASGNYIDKMSDYCGQCRYDVKLKIGESACPYNALYWDFLIRNQAKLRSNPRLGHVYRNWDRMEEDKRSAYLAHANTIKEAL